MGKAVRDNLQRLDHNRNILLSEMRDIDRELSAKQEEIRRIFSVAGVENEGEFIKKKTLYENKVLRLAELNGSMDELEREMDENRIYIEKIKTLMLDRLGTCGIIALEENEIKSEHVKTFREGLAKYLEAIENLKRLNEKREDAAKYLQSLYDRASSLFGESFAKKEDLLRSLDGMDLKINELYEKLRNIRWKFRILTALRIILRNIMS